MCSPTTFDIAENLVALTPLKSVTYTYSVPVVSHILGSLQGGCLFAKLDLAEAYQQLPVDEAMVAAQTIVTHQGAFKIKCLQFGVSVAPGIFQGVMEQTLKGIPGVCPYFDDVLITGENAEVLAEWLRAILQRFRTVGLRLKKEKCKIGVESMEFLGSTLMPMASIWQTQN
ncbi:putative protein K02A2.6-like [Crotalus adamanteus]|uniref:ribonuclease H n=1 Tax=Crotalus adamanteus TaxID=8729 RepID=A0AAW1C6N5_CROAD